MSTELSMLAARIRSEMSELAVVTNRAQTAWQKAKSDHDDFYVDSAALNLHGFYSGLERLFQLIASRIDEFTPHGSDWYQELLRQMGTNIPNIRPQVISSETVKLLDQYRGFRHVVRNVYTFTLDPVRIGLLIDGLAETFARVEKELGQFVDFLEGCAVSMS